MGHVARISDLLEMRVVLSSESQQAIFEDVMPCVSTNSTNVSVEMKIHSEGFFEILLPTYRNTRLHLQENCNFRKGIRLLCALGMPGGWYCNNENYVDF